MMLRLALFRPLLLTVSLLICNAYDVAMAATVTTNLLRYAFNTTPIKLSWNYTSKSDWDVVAIMYNDTIPTIGKVGMQMFLYITTLRRDYYSCGIKKDIGTVTFDGNDPDERNAQTWPLKTGHYKAYIFDSYQFGGTIYAVSDTFTVFTSTLSSNKPLYFMNEPITFFLDYVSSYTDTGERNQDIISIYDSTIENVDLLNPIMYVFVSTFVKNNFNLTIRNNGTVTFGSQPLNESGVQSWPLQVGSYKAILWDRLTQRVYVKSESFTVGPATIGPTKSPISPTKVPTNAPSIAPSVAPIQKRKQLFCNVFILKNIFCSDRCGFIGRLLKSC